MNVVTEEHKQFHGFYNKNMSIYILNPELWTVWSKIKPLLKLKWDASPKMGQYITTTQVAILSMHLFSSAYHYQGHLSHLP